MKSLIVISAPRQIVYEATVLTAMFGRGLETLHLRKPQFSLRETERLLKQIPARYHKRIVLHSHYGLADRYAVKGIHISQSVRQQWPLFAIAWKARHPRLQISTLFHDLGQLQTATSVYDYVFVGPVFEQVSVKNHNPIPDKKVLEAAVRQSPCKTIALGGITGHTLHELSSMGFDGAAVVNAIWKAEDPVEACISLMKEMEKADRSVALHRIFNIERPLGNTALKTDRIR
jgi:thiamine-phosphate pyrophosphorylase